MAGEFFQDDLDNGAFFDTDDFAYTAVYTPSGGDPSDVDGNLIDLRMRINPYTGENDTNTDALFVCPFSKVTGVKQGDAIVVNSTNYEVKVVNSSLSDKIAVLGINKS